MPSTGIDRVTGNTTSVAVKAPVTVVADHNIVLSGLQVIDGVMLAAANGDALADRVLVNGQTDPTQNGIYLANTLAWARAYDFDGARDAVQGTEVFVRSGNLYGQTSWYLNTADNPIEFGVSDISFSLNSITPGASNFLHLVGAADASPVTYVSLTAVGTSAHIGVDYNSVGTTTAPSQYNGMVGGVYSAGTSGRHRFKINGVSNFEVADTYFNPDVSYPGPVTSRIVVSGGRFNGVAGGDNIAVISVEDTLYPNPGVIDGLTIAYMAKGTDGSHHFCNNGLIAHVNIAATTNPNGRDQYCAPESALWMYGSPTGVHGGVVFATQGGTQYGTLFYDSGTGGYEWLSDNIATRLFKMNRIALGVNAWSVTAAIAGQSPILQPYGASTNIGALYMTKGSGNSNHTFYDGGKPQVQIGGTSAAASYLTLGADSGGVLLSAQNNGSANPNFTMYTVGTGDFTFASSNLGHTLLNLKDNYNVIMGNSAQGTTDTAGFLFLPSCAGPPTGTPASIPSNRVAWMYDRTNNQIYIYNAGWKKTVALT